MKERGSSPTSTIELSKNRQTAPHTQQEKPLSPTIINASGHRFRSVESIPYEGILDAMFHYYEGARERNKNLSIVIIEMGLTDPKRKNEPITLRIDHGCPCMEMKLAGHDCAQQRELAMDAMQKIGRGMMVLVNTESSAGMGHGIFHVMKNQKVYQEARLSGEQKTPTMIEYFRNEGIKDFDVRKHPEIAALIARRLKAMNYNERENPLGDMRFYPLVDVFPYYKDILASRKKSKSRIRTIFSRKKRLGKITDYELAA